MQNAHWDVFLHGSEQFLNLLILMPFKYFCCFLFHLFHIGKTFPFEDFFHPRKHKKITWSKIGWIGRVGQRSHTIFGQKLLNTQCGVGRRARKSCIMKCANALSILKKKFTEAEHSFSQQCQLVHRYRWVPRTLTYWEKPVLQGANPPEDNSGILAGGRGSPFKLCEVRDFDLFCYILHCRYSIIICWMERMNEWMRDGLDDISKFFPSSLTVSLENQDQYFLFCFLYKSFLPPSVAESSKNCDQSLSSFTSFPKGKGKGLCQPFTHNQLFPVPTTFSTPLVL